MDHEKKKFLSFGKSSLKDNTHKNPVDRAEEEWKRHPIPKIASSLLSSRKKKISI